MCYASNPPKIFKAIENNNINYITEYFKKYPEEINDIRELWVPDECGDYIPKDYTPLTYACEVEADMATIKKLVELGADVNQEAHYKTPFSIAVKTDNFELVKFLVEMNATPEFYDIWQYSVLVEAMEYGRERITEYLLNNQVGINTPSGHIRYTPLMTAVMLRRADYVKKLLEAGADIDTTNVDGETALDLALKIAPDIAEIIRSYKNSSIQS